MGDRIILSEDETNENSLNRDDNTIVANDDTDVSDVTSTKNWTRSTKIFVTEQLYFLKQQIRNPQQNDNGNSYIDTYINMLNEKIGRINYMKEE